MTGLPEWLKATFSAAWLLAISGSVLIARVVALQRLTSTMVRRDRNQCLSCGYDLTANASGVCPECGKTTSAA
jgi:hypothetical protein